MIAAIIQARCGSCRFPNKIFADLQGKPLIWHVVNRLTFSRRLDKIILATTVNPIDDKLVEWANENHVDVFRGSENDVLKRYYDAAKKFKVDIVVRITADDPFKEPVLVDKVIDTLEKTKSDFVSNNNPPSFPEGLDVEVFTFDVLSQMHEKSDSDFEREHVTQYVYRHPAEFKIGNITNDKNLSSLRWTIDTEKDYKMASEVYRRLYSKTSKNVFHMKEILQLLHEYPEIAELNSDVARSEMYKNK